MKPLIYCEARGSVILLQGSLNHFGIVSKGVFLSEIPNLTL